MDLTRTSPAYSDYCQVMPAAHTKSSLSGTGDICNFCGAEPMESEEDLAASLTNEMAPPALVGNT